MTSIASNPEHTESAASASRQRLGRVYLLFALSGAAGLVYEVVWFHELRLTIGADSQSLAVVLASFMGGLFLGSLLFARMVGPARNPLKVYAVLELGIAGMGLLIPVVLGWLRTVHLGVGDSPYVGLAIRSVICAALLGPPTVMMGATLPALSRWIRADSRQHTRISRLYALNTFGAVAGTVGTAFFIAPALGYDGANLVAVGLNVLVAAVAWGIARGRDADWENATDLDTVVPEVSQGDSLDRAPIYLAYALNGAAALGFEVLWSRLLAMAFGATVYAFALVLGVFLFGLAIGAAIGANLAARVRNPRTALAALQLCSVAAVGGTSLLVPVMAAALAGVDERAAGDPLVVHLTNLVRTLVVVLPGAVVWGMSFPMALRCLGRDEQDAARRVGRLYAFNTVGAVLGALGVSFVLLPRVGGVAAAAHLVILPIAAAVVLLLSKARGMPSGPLPYGRGSVLAGAVVAALLALIAFGTRWPSELNSAVRGWLTRPEGVSDWVFLAGIPGLVALAMFLHGRVVHWWTYVLALGGVGFALSTSVPIKLYVYGARFGRSGAPRDVSNVVWFEEGVFEPVAVFAGDDGTLAVSINSRVCASAAPNDMQTQRLLGHVPVLLAEDPRDVLVVGLGAGVTAGATAIHDRVDRVRVVELEPKVAIGAKHFGESNHQVMEHPKVEVIIDDGRRYIAASREKFGVITSDPVHARLAGAAALFTVEYYTLCRDHLIEGGMFTQWIGLYELSEDGLRSLLSAFARVFPEGVVWLTPTDLVLVGSTGPVRMNVEQVRERIASDAAVAESLAFVQINGVEDLAARCVFRIESVQDWLAGATVNTDRNMHVQFASGHSFLRLDLPSLPPIVAKHRRFEEKVFKMPAKEADEFHRRVENLWGNFEKELDESDD